MKTNIATQALPFLLVCAVVGSATYAVGCATGASVWEGAHSGGSGGEEDNAHSGAGGTGGADTSGSSGSGGSNTSGCTSEQIECGSECCESSTHRCVSETCEIIPGPECNQAGELCDDGTVCNSAMVCIKGCFIDKKIVEAGAIDPTNACNVCTPSSSTAEWTPLDAGASCGVNGHCASGSCFENSCNIPGVGVVGQGAASPTNPCMICDTSKSGTAWTPRPVGESCGAGFCQTSGLCSAGGCSIEGIVYGEGATKSGSPCEYCNSSIDGSHWSILPGGSKCGEGFVCNGTTCDKGCWIDERFVAHGTALSGCMQCNALANPAGWSVTANGVGCGAQSVCFEGGCSNGCWIGGTYTSHGGKIGDCGTCDTSKNMYAPTQAPDGTSCGSGKFCGGGVCETWCSTGSSYVPPGTANSSCQVCSTSNPGTWTGVSLVNGGFETISNPTWMAGSNYEPDSQTLARSTDMKRTGSYAARLGWFTNYPYDGDYATVYATVDLTGVEQITYYTATGKSNATSGLVWYTECWVGGSANIHRNGTRIGNYLLPANTASGWTQRTVSVPLENRKANQVLKFVNYISTGAFASFGAEIFYVYVDDISFSCSP